MTLLAGRDGESKEVAIGEFATLEESDAPATIAHENSQKTITVTAEVADGYNNALLSRELQRAGRPVPTVMSFGGELQNIDLQMTAHRGFVLLADGGPVTTCRPSSS